MATDTEDEVVLVDQDDDQDRKIASNTRVKGRVSADGADGCC